MTYRFAFARGASSSLLFDASEAMSFEPRSKLAEAVRERDGLALCGDGVSCAR